MIETEICNAENRPTATDSIALLTEGDKEWLEFVIQPFDRGMAPLGEGGRMQWAEEEMIIIPGWVYRLLGWAWPVLRLVYTKPLRGQHTEY